MPKLQARATATPLSIAILGTGFSGLCLAMRLKAANIESFVVFEKSATIGGTWRDNTYPGAGCDVPSRLYSFSFEQNFEWAQVYAGQDEILRYLEHCVRKHQLMPHIRFGTEIVEAEFDAVAALWRLRTAQGEAFEAKIVVSSVGQLNRARVPKIDGLETFGGTFFHSAAWNHRHELTGRRVGIVGNGASAVQFTPHVVRSAQAVTVFQRHPSWIIPPIPKNRRYRRWERLLQRQRLFARLHRFFMFLLYESRTSVSSKGSLMNALIRLLATFHMKVSIRDETLRRQLTPDYPLGCKRILLSTDYYPALTRPNVVLSTSSIERVVSDGIVTCDGVHHKLDTIIFGTGFEAASFLPSMDFKGPGGRLLSDVWRNGAEAYLGMMVAGFPNLFLMYGPNTNLGHNSIVFMIECQATYIIKCIQHIMAKSVDTLCVRRDVQDNYNGLLARKLSGTHWASDCGNWYKTAAGKITNNWGGSATSYWWKTRTLKLDVFENSAPI